LRKKSCSEGNPTSPKSERLTLLRVRKGLLRPVAEKEAQIKGYPKDSRSAEKEERNKRLRGIPLETLKKRRDEKACQRCGSKGHSQ
jgi:hypothetical protein